MLRSGEYFQDRHSALISGMNLAMRSWPMPTVFLVARRARDSFASRCRTMSPSLRGFLLAFPPQSRGLMLLKPLPQRVVHPGLPARAARLERLYHVLVVAHGQLHLRAVQARAPSPTLELGHFSLAQFVRIRVCRDAGVDRRIFLRGGHDQPLFKLRHSALP